MAVPVTVPALSDSMGRTLENMIPKFELLKPGQFGQNVMAAREDILSLDPEYRRSLAEANFIGSLAATADKLGTIDPLIPTYQKWAEAQGIPENERAKLSFVAKGKKSGIVIEDPSTGHKLTVPSNLDARQVLKQTAVAARMAQGDPANNIKPDMNGARNIIGGLANLGVSFEELKDASGRYEIKAEYDPALKKIVNVRYDKASGMKLGILGEVKDPNEKVTTLRKEYAQEAKNIQASAEGYARVLASPQSEEEATGASDMNLLFGYMKLLDPNSTVREGEYATIQQTGSIPQQIVAMYNRAVNGQKLEKEQRRAIFAQSHRSAAEMEKMQQALMDKYAGIAQNQGIGPERLGDVTTDYFKTTRGKVSVAREVPKTVPVPEGMEEATEVLSFEDFKKLPEDMNVSKMYRAADGREYFDVIIDGETYSVPREYLIRTQNGGR